MTHLRVEINRIINIQTFSLPKDNTSQPFYYDRQPGSPFSVPAGFSFVITDIIIQPETTTLTPNQFFLVVITVGGARSFTSRSDGRTQHYPLAAGLVIPSGASLDARNTTFSTGTAEIQLLGYFVKETLALGIGKPFTS